MRKPKAGAKSKSFEVGYRRPPKKHQFRPGRSGNPVGINRRADRSAAPDLRASLERELQKKIRIKRGKSQRVTTQAEAGISELVHQFAKGNPRARRDLLSLAQRVDVDLAPAKTIEDALAEAISAEDEALLTDFVRRHGGQYPLNGNSVEGANLLAPPSSDAKLLAAPPASSTELRIVQDEEPSNE